MINVFQTSQPLPCIVREIRRSGLTKIIATTYCSNEEHDAAVGLLQLPDTARCCSTCTTIVKRLEQQLAGQKPA